MSAELNAPREPVREPVLEVVDAGLLTTIQDLGRPGLAALGVAPGGAADPLALAVANRVLGNARDAAALELTIAGPTLRILATTTIALAGADLAARVVETGERLAPGSALVVRAGWMLAFAGPPTRGIRAYLAVPGGFLVDDVLGSSATALGAGFGGLGGRALRAGDRLSSRRAGVVAPARWPGPVQPDSHSIRILPGPHAARIGEAALANLVAGTWTVSPASDRVGLRLEGGALPGTATGELASHGVTWGAIQVPPDGHPIVLLVDHQPTGGYPVVAVAITADRPRLGQLGPGSPIRFELVDGEAARAALLDQREQFAAAERHLAELAGWDELWESTTG